MEKANSKTKLRTKINLGVLATLIVVLGVLIWFNRDYFFSRADSIDAAPAESTLSYLTINPSRDIATTWQTNPPGNDSRHWSLLDEDNPNFSDYIVSNANAVNEEILGFSPIAGIANIKSVKVAVYAKRQDETPTQLVTNLKIGDWQKGATYSTLSGQWQYFQANFTGSWTQNEINQLQVNLASSGGVALVSKVYVQLGYEQK